MDCICTPRSTRRRPTQTCSAVLAFLLIGYIQKVNCGLVMGTENTTLLDSDSGKQSKRVAPYIAYLVEPAESWCYNKSDGIYSHPQFTNNYYMCRKGDAKLHQCDEGLVFNELSLNCEQNTSSPVNLCDQQRDGFIPDYFLTDCQQYYRCESGILIDKRSCDYGMKFSITEQSCQIANRVSCTYSHCIGSADGYFITPGSKCKSYYTCKNEKIRHFDCPEGYFFDSNAKTCSASGGNCYELICTGRTNGLYPDATHRCSRYYSCEGGQLKLVGGCPAGTLFNGSSCVNSFEVSCGTAEESAISITVPATDSCTGFKDSVHSGYDEHCQSYILCKSERTIAELQCPSGQRFDGRKCVSADLVSCLSFCSDKENGVYANTKRHCQEYIECVDGNLASTNKCPQGTVYNGFACVSFLTYRCPISEVEQHSYNNHCLNLTDGIHTNYLSSCKEYFYCNKGELLIYNSCLSDMVWNGNECVPVSNYTCEGPHISPQCSARGNGFFIDNSKTSNCNKYYFCNEGLQVRLQCPKDYAFNGFNCVPLQSYKCPFTDADCYDKADGYYADTTSGCQSYYFCSDGSKITYLCSDGQVFNGHECVSTNLFRCPGNKSDACHLLSNGYYPDVREKCETYFYCLNNKKIMTFKCPFNEIFDGYKCVHSETSTCQNFPRLTCNVLKDSIYIKPGSDCKEYFQCSGKKMMGLKKCQDGLLFNGTICAKMPSDDCKTVMKKQTDDLSKCSIRSNGFYPDLISGCKTYFYCIDGVKTTLTCPSGKLFNGEICVNDFHCPASNIINVNLSQ